MEKLLHEFGFETIYPETYDIGRQIELFSQAEWIAGASGAALTNLLFCKPGCRVICFTNIKIPFSGFSTIARWAGAEMIYFNDIRARYTDTASIHQSFKVDVSRLSEYLHTEIG